MTPTSRESVAFVESLTGVLAAVGRKMLQVLVGMEMCGLPEMFVMLLGTAAKFVPCPRCTTVKLAVLLRTGNTTLPPRHTPVRETVTDGACTLSKWRFV